MTETYGIGPINGSLAVNETIVPKTVIERRAEPDVAIRIPRLILILMRRSAFHVRSTFHVPQEHFTRLESAFHFVMMPDTSPSWVSVW